MIGPAFVIRGSLVDDESACGLRQLGRGELVVDSPADIVVESAPSLAPRDLIPMHPPVAPAERKAAAEAGEENGKEHFKDIPDNKPKGPLSQDQQTEVKTTLSRGPMFSEVR